MLLLLLLLLLLLPLERFSGGRSERTQLQQGTVPYSPKQKEHLWRKRNSTPHVSHRNTKLLHRFTLSFGAKCGVSYVSEHGSKSSSKGTRRPQKNFSNQTHGNKTEKLEQTERVFHGRSQTRFHPDWETLRSKHTTLLRSEDTSAQQIQSAMWRLQVLVPPSYRIGKTGLTCTHTQSHTHTHTHTHLTATQRCNPTWRTDTLHTQVYV